MVRRLSSQIERLQCWNLRRQATKIVREEAGSRSFDVTVPVGLRSVGVKGDERHRGHVAMVTVSRLVDDPAERYYKVVEKISNRLTNEINDIGRVTLDVTWLKTPPL